MFQLGSGVAAVLGRVVGCQSYVLFVCTNSVANYIHCIRPRETSSTISQHGACDVAFHRRDNWTILALSVDRHDDVTTGGSWTQRHGERTLPSENQNKGVCIIIIRLID
jgi:hypothetical protein